MSLRVVAVEPSSPSGIAISSTIEKLEEALAFSLVLSREGLDVVHIENGAGTAVRGEGLVRGNPEELGEVWVTKRQRLYLVPSIVCWTAAYLWSAGEFLGDLPAGLWRLALDRCRPNLLITTRSDDRTTSVWPSAADESRSLQAELPRRSRPPRTVTMAASGFDWRPR